MKIFLAGFGYEVIDVLERVKTINLLFSYYDLSIGTFPFRKKSYSYIIKNRRRKKK